MDNSLLAVSDIKNKYEEERMADFMNKNRLITKMAGTLTAAIVITNTALTAANVYAADASTDGKEEVVYVMTDASGKTDSVNVVNIFGKGSVTDYGDYSSVKMLNSTEDIEQSGNKVTFTTDKDRVYYQGTLDDAETPWNISITYKLDGKTVTPEELAGADGKLEIHIAITKNDKCATDFYDSYALQAAFTLDTDKCENIVADGATMANVGSDKQISYTVLPGKGLDADITVDVTDFEMDAAAINGVKLDLNMDIDDAELMDKVKEIQDATKELNDGASDLSDGSEKLADGGSSLVDGAEALNTGAAALDNGISSLDSGVNQMQTALDTLNSKSKNLTDGSDQMLTALKTIQSQFSGVSVSTSQLKQLTDSSSAIKQGISDAYSGAVALQQGISYDSYKATMSTNGLDMDTLQTGNTQAIQNLAQQIETLSASVEQLKSIPGYENNEQYAAQVAQLEAQIESLKQVVQLLQGNSAAIGGTEQYLNALSKGADDLVAGLSELNTKYEQFDAAINELANSLSGMVVKVSTLKTGIDQLVSAYENLDSGVDQYTDGVASVVAAYSQIVDGTNSLAGGSRELANGSQTLKSGTVDLYNGITSLDDGTKQLLDGTNEFYEMTSDMDTQVQDQIDDMLDEISGGDESVVSFVSDKNTNVKAVQFVIKTAAIEKEEAEETESTTTEKKSFWEKLVDLF